MPADPTANPAAKRKEKNRNGVRSERILLITNDDDNLLLATTAELCQRAQNRLLFYIKLWHIEQGNDTPIRQWITEYRVYQAKRQQIFSTGYDELRAKPGPKPDPNDQKKRRENREKIDAKAKKELGPPPKCPVVFLPKEASKEIRAKMIEAFPQLHDKVLGQLIHSATQDLGRHQASIDCFSNDTNRDGRSKKWHRIVADLGEQASYARRQPIPLKPEQLTVHIPEDPNPDSTWSVTIRLDRYLGKTAAGKPKFTSTPTSFELTTKEPKRANPKPGDKPPKPKLAKIRHTLQRCYGHAEAPEYEYDPKGSKILERDGKWYLLLPYQQKKWVPMKCDKRRTATFKPAQDHPWLLIIKGDNIRVKGHGNIIAKVRERLNIKGQTRRESAKGGRDKARGYKRVHRRRVTMDTFKRTFTRQTVAQVIRILADRQIGKLEVHLPQNPYTANQTYLAKAGAPANRPESWPWQFLESELRRQAERLGFELTIKKLEYPKEDKKDKKDKKAG